MNVTLQFGSSSNAWPVSFQDFVIAEPEPGTCVGAFFAIDTSGTTAPPWIVGDVFLKNVYAVFRASPAAVGFAELSDTAKAMDGKLGNAPSATIGVAATVTGSSASEITSTVRATDNGAMHVQGGAFGLWLVALLCGVVGGSALL